MQAPRKWWIGAAASLVPAALSVLFVWGSLRNDRVPSFRDQSDFFFPSHVYTASRLRSLSLPLWNPLAGNGESWIGDGQNEIFYPPALVFLLGNSAVATGIFLLFHFVLAYLFFLGFLRARAVSRSASVLGAAVYAFSGGAASLSAYWNHFAGFAWIPAMAWAAQLGLVTRRQRAAFAASLAAAVLAGSPEMALFGLVLAAFVFFFEGRLEQRLQLETGRVRRRAVRFFLTSTIAGILLSSVQAIPILDSWLQSRPRSSVWPGQMGLRQLLGAVTAPSLSNWAWLPAGAGYLQSLYVSLRILLLPAAAFRLVERRTERVGWVVLIGSSLAISFLPFGAPFRYPSKLFAIALFALSVVAAEGVDGLRFALSGRSRGIAGAAFLAAAALGFFFLSRTLPERVSIAGLGIFLALAAWTRSSGRSSVFSGLFAALAAASAAAHLVLAALPLGRTVSLGALLDRPLQSRGKVLTSEDEILADWANRALPDEETRVRRQTDALSGYTNLLFGVRKARTPAALPGRSQQLFMQSLTGLRNFVPAATISGCGEIRFPRGEKMARVLVPDPLSGATFFFQDRVESDPLEALRAISSAHVDFRKVLAVGAGQRLAISGEDRPRLAVASLVKETPERMEYTVSLSRDAWLYLPMSWDRWWESSVDGRRASIARANGVFSAVLVPAGSHRVVWRYWPWPFYAGAVLSCLTLLWLLLQAAA